MFNSKSCYSPSTSSDVLLSSVMALSDQSFCQLNVITPAGMKNGLWHLTAFPAPLNCMYTQTMHTQYTLKFTQTAPDVVQTRFFRFTPASDSNASQVSTCDWVSPPCSHCFFVLFFFSVRNGLLGASLWVVFSPWYSQGIHLHSQCTTCPLYISMFGNVYSIYFLSLFFGSSGLSYCAQSHYVENAWWTTQQKVKQKCSDGCALRGAGQTVRNVFS